MQRQWPVVCLACGCQGALPASTADRAPQALASSPSGTSTGACALPVYEVAPDEELTISWATLPDPDGGVLTWDATPWVDVWLLEGDLAATAGACEGWMIATRKGGPTYNSWDIDQVMRVVVKPLAVDTVAEMLLNIPRSGAPDPGAAFLVVATAGAATTEVVIDSDCWVWE